jgi:hypothetical protein
VHRRPHPVNKWEVNADDFIGAVQGNINHRRHVNRVLLESLDAVLRPLNHQDGPHCQEPASVKKMMKGDTTWATCKVVLGWMINTITMTIQLPAHRILHLNPGLDSPYTASDHSEQVANTVGRASLYGIGHPRWQGVVQCASECAEEQV